MAHAIMSILALGAISTGIAIIIGLLFNIIAGLAAFLIVGGICTMILMDDVHFKRGLEEIFKKAEQ